MKSKSTQYWLFVSIVTLSVIVLGVIFLVSLGQDSPANTLDVRLEPGSTLGTVTLVNVQSSYQYSLDEGQTWLNVPTQSQTVEDLAVQAGDTILVRDTARAGFSQALTVRAQDLGT